MIKNFFGLMFLVVFAAGATVFAGEQCAMQGKTKAEGCKTACGMNKKNCACKGEVVSVDVAANTISLKCKKGDCQVSLTNKTKIMQGKEVKTITDIKPGSNVIVKYSTKDGKNEATKILIEPGCHQMPPAIEKK
ncbi:MAG: hypothetical protein A3J83_02310 [Elusimicrobia bacterium RIFOXYA2_FULL_40_6]|nr:MAG: hypothetical protein A3J83_02310 [Elusimicrobia bacterium RIFOXYA2_FULL_40_6]